MTTRRQPPRAVTIKDIAARCGVHFMTVSRALRGGTAVRASTAARIREAAARLGYDPENGHAARRLVARAGGAPVRNHVIGMFFPPNFVRNAYFADLFEGIVEELAPAGYSVHVIPTYAPEHPERMLAELPPVLRRGEIDGAIVTSWPEHMVEVLRQLRQVPHFADRPILSLLAEIPGCSPVLTDDHAGMYAATQHLLDLGHRSFMHGYADDPRFTSYERLRGITQACVERGLDPARHLFYYGLDWHSPLNRRMEKPLRDARREHPEITAVLAPNDFYAVQAARVLAEMGLRIPRDISLVGFDDVVPLPDAAHENILTTVRLPLEEVGREAARRLLRRLDAPAAPPDEQRLPVTFIPRGTTAPPPRRRASSPPRVTGVRSR